MSVDCESSVSSTHSRSSLYRGYIRHRRYLPIEHEFSYQITMLMIDLDYVDDELNQPPFIRISGPAPGWFRRSDYVGDQTITIKQEIVARVRQESGLEVNGKVLLLTHLRYWGFIMNPIAIFYCYDDSGKLIAAVLQVTNTPWKEKTTYVVPIRWQGRNHLSKFDKQMHVSPFNPMDMHYLCRLQSPDRTLFFHLENHTSNECHTDATMVFERLPMTKPGLIGLCLRQPAMTLKVGLAIYWQALRLWLKGARIHDHPENSNSTGNGIS